MTDLKGSERTSPRDFEDQHLQYTLTGFHSSGRFIQSATPVREYGSNRRHDFISFLATAQALDIDFLPITWQPALESIGKGGTADIREAYINIQSSYAFKRVKRSRQNQVTENEIFRALISEILVLGQPSIRSHPNIIRLDGICWDILPSASGVWPALLFEKSELGDAEKFVHSDFGKSTSWSDRLGLCADVGSAIHEMHFCCTAHILV
jgi:hypothetical protein